ncbi:MAG: SRPBCC family protein [Acidimicrobiales bacterium]
MASVIKEIHIDARPEEVWAALRDFAAVHERLVPGFVVDSHLDGDDTRVVTFFNGVVAREVLVGVDDEARRLAYTVVESPMPTTHHNASAQVFADSEGGSRFVWITDVLPDEFAAGIGDLMQHGIGVIKQTLEGATASS